MVVVIKLKGTGAINDGINVTAIIPELINNINYLYSSSEAQKTEKEKIKSEPV